MADDTGTGATNSADNGPETNETGAPDTDSADTHKNGSAGNSDGNADESADSFPREYVETLRKESADHRTKAKAAEDRADALAKRLHLELVRATGKLENPADLPFDSEHLENPDAMGASIAALLDERPYFAKRVVTGDVGQGSRGGDVSGPQGFADLFR